LHRLQSLRLLHLLMHLLMRLLTYPLPHLLFLSFLQLLPKRLPVLPHAMIRMP
jgi:hypothetical protein